MKRLLLSVCLLSGAGLVAATAPAALPPSAGPSVLVCGGAMMNGDHFSDGVLPVLRRHYAGCKKIMLVLHATLPADRDQVEERLQKAFAHLGGMAAESLHRHDAARPSCCSANFTGRVSWNSSGSACAPACPTAARAPGPTSPVC